MSEFKPTYKHLWMVEDTEIPDPETGRNKSFWTKIGVAFQNRDGSWSLELSAIPVNGRLQMRDPRPRDQSEGTEGKSNGARKNGAVQNGVSASRDAVAA